MTFLLYTGVLIAVTEEHLETVELLQSKGADVNSSNDNGQAPVDGGSSMRTYNHGSISARSWCI